MQCYEYQAMLMYVQAVVEPMKLPIIVDEALAADILEKLFITDMSTLLSLDKRLIRDRALDEQVDVRHAA